MGVLRHAALVSILALAGGCANSIYFYETEKISINIEGRPDPSSPVSGNIGIKQRVVAVVPAKKVDGEGYPDGDAVSLYSRFNFEKNDDGVLIETVLLTGEAPRLAAKSNQGAAVFEAVAGVDEFGRSSRSDCIRRWLADDPQRRPDIQAFLDDNGIGRRVTTWLNSSGEPGREAEYQRFIDANGVICD